MKKTKSEKSPKTKVKNPGRNKKLQERSARVMAGNVGRVSVGAQMRAAGYSFSYSRTPSCLKRGKSFQRLIEQYLPDEELLITHRSLKNSRKLDHMVFPIVVKDEEIQEMLASVNCILRKVIHSENAKHAYFWSPDNRARKDALDSAYKLKGLYAPEKFEDVTKNPYKDMSDEELAKKRREQIALLKKKDNK